jgi:hypothetical protein
MLLTAVILRCEPGLSRVSLEGRAATDIASFEGRFAATSG